MGGLCGIFGLITTSAAASEPQQQIATLTVLKEWTPNGDVNGTFEAERRAWLASLRKDRVTIDPNQITSEELEDISAEPADENEFSRELLNDYMGQIRREIE